MCWVTTIRRSIYQTPEAPCLTESGPLTRARTFLLSLVPKVSHHISMLCPQWPRCPRGPGISHELWLKNAQRGINQLRKMKGLCFGLNRLACWRKKSILDSVGLCEIQQIRHLLPVWPCISYFSDSSSFICKIGILILTLQKLWGWDLCVNGFAWWLIKQVLNK